MATTIYTFKNDTYSDRAKALLTEKKIEFTEKSVKNWGTVTADTEISSEDLKKIAPAWQRGPVTVMEDNSVVCGLKALQEKLA
jgi:glutaredoxin